MIRGGEGGEVLTSDSSNESRKANHDKRSGSRVSMNINHRVVGEGASPEIKSSYLYEGAGAV